MKAPNVGDTIGIIRHLDELGRIVIPKEIRKTLNIQDGDALEIFATSEGAYVRKVKER